MRCDECKFWRGDNHVRAGKLIFGKCGKTLQWWDSTEWLKESHINGDSSDNMRRLIKEAENVKFFTMDASDYYSCLMTSPDFFCANFEQLTKSEEQKKE